MKKAQWLIALTFMAVGMICLIIPAMAFRDMSILQFGRSIGIFYVSIMAIGGIIALIYYFLIKRKNS